MEIYNCSHINILCPKEWVDARSFAQNTLDKSFDHCISRLMSWGFCDDDDVTLTICRDFDKHCFNFAFTSKDGKPIVNGGIIYHGKPAVFERYGYSYGWHIHT